LNTLVIEQTEHGEVPMDVYQKLAKDRILFITDYLNDDVATDLIATLLLKDHENPDEKVRLLVNCPGGDIRNAFMIYDVMTMMHAPVEVLVMGAAMDEASVIVAGARKGMRLATKNAIFSVSQLNNPWHMHTNLVDAKRLMDQFNSDNNRLLDIYAKATGKTVKQLRIDLDRRAFLNAQKAMKFGLIDKIVAPNK
jgi:ATP-dependent Clp protease, protease subunit